METLSLLIFTLIHASTHSHILVIPTICWFDSPPTLWEDGVVTYSSFKQKWMKACWDFTVVRSLLVTIGNSHFCLRAHVQLLPRPVRWYFRRLDWDIHEKTWWCGMIPWDWRKPCEPELWWRQNKIQGKGAGHLGQDIWHTKREIKEARRGNENEVRDHSSDILCVYVCVCVILF